MKQDAHFECSKFSVPCIYFLMFTCFILHFPFHVEGKGMPIFLRPVVLIWPCHTSCSLNLFFVFPRNWSYIWRSFLSVDVAPEDFKNGINATVVLFNLMESSMMPAQAWNDALLLEKNLRCYSFKATWAAAFLSYPGQVYLARLQFSC